MKNIFILGGSPLQVDLLETAKASYYTILIDGDANCALRDKADEFFALDFSDVDKLYKLALEKKPHLILTMASEQGNISAAIVSDRLGIKYNAVDTVYATINKVAMKQRMVDSNVQTSNYFVVDRDQESIDIQGKAEFPLIVKPSHSSGGRGVKLVNSIEELNEAVSTAKKISSDSCVLIEEYITGDQYSIETITCNGVHSILGITNEYFSNAPYFAEIQDLYPSNMDDRKQLLINEFVSNVLKGFDIQYGACHIELRVTAANEIYLIEIASRIGGFRSELIKYSTGVYYTNLLIQSHEKDTIEVVRNYNKYCIVKMLFNEEDLKNHQLIRNNPLYNTTPIVWLKQGFTKNTTSLMDSSGCYYIVANNIEEALHVL